KSDVGGVRLGLTDPESLREAVDDLRGLGERFLIERLVDDAVAELIVGVRRDPSLGTALTIGSGGVLVELMGDSITLRAPVGEEEVAGALDRKSTRLNSSHVSISYAVFCLKKKKEIQSD